MLLFRYLDIILFCHETLYIAPVEYCTAEDHWTKIHFRHKKVTNVSLHMSITELISHKSTAVVHHG